MASVSPLCGAASQRELSEKVYAHQELELWAKVLNHQGVRLVILEKGSGMRLIIGHFNLQHVVDEIAPFISGFTFGLANFSAVRIIDGVKSGSDTWESYVSVRDQEYTEYILLDARTQMDEIRTALGITMKKKTETKSKAGPQQYRMIVKTHGDPSLSMLVQRIAFSVGFNLNGNSQAVPTPDDALLFRWNRRDEKTIYTSGGYAAEKMQKDAKESWGTAPPILDARTELGDILEYFTGEANMGMEMLVSNQLMDFIRAHPKDEMVGGFIRKELGLNLTEKVQAGGPDAILKWIKKNVVVDVPAPKRKYVPPEPQLFKIKISMRHSGRHYWTRSDEVELEGEVPANVVEQSVSTGDHRPIEKWMLQNSDELTELSNQEGEESISDTERDDDSPEFECVISSDIKDKLKAMKNEK